MKILVDYDNVPYPTSRPGLVYLADRILTRVSSATNTIGAIDFRLYGGWDRNSKLTKQGQDLSTEMKSKFPRSMRTGHTPVLLTMQLAQSLEALPKKILTNTLREEPMRKMKCLVPSKTTCRNNPCPIDPMAEFINSGSCPVDGCVAKPAILLSRSEQKLVDTMMVADLIHLANRGETQLCIVSSDDDMWPGILCALNMGANVIHLHTGVLNERPTYLTTTRGIYTPMGL